MDNKANNRVKAFQKAASNFNDSDKMLSDLVDEVSQKDADFWTDPFYNRRDKVHSLFQYPAMMVPTVQKRLVEIVLNVDKNVTSIFDPFTGSSTSLIVGMQHGLNCYGQDVNPLALLLSKVKVGPYFENAFSIQKEEVVSKAKLDTSIEVEASFSTIDKWFRKDVQIGLSRIVRAIRALRSVVARRFFWIVLAETIRFSSNDRTSTFKLHARPEKEITDRKIDPLSIFERIAKRSLIDIKEFKKELKDDEYIKKGRYIFDVEIDLKDSKKGILDRGEKFDLLVSSPPYGDNKTTVPYGQHSYLPLQWIDLEDIAEGVTKAYLKTTAEIDNQSLGGSLKKLDGKTLGKLYLKSPTLRNTISKLLLEHEDKISKVLNFTYDFDLSLTNIVNALRKDAYMIWTIGNRRVGGMEIKNDQILIELLQSKGAILVKNVEREILNKRMALRNNKVSTMNQEQILIFRKIV